MRDFPRDIRNPHCDICKILWADMMPPMESEDGTIKNVPMCNNCYEEILERMQEKAAKERRAAAKRSGA